MVRLGATGGLAPRLSRVTRSPSTVNLTLQLYLQRAKREIDHRQDDWDRYKKYTNACEYVHTPVPGGKSAVCRLRPLSRSFYKMVELLQLNGLGDELPTNACTFHFAEGPGGFIEALVHQRQGGEGDLHYGMTLIDDDDPAVPGWKKSNGFLSRNEHVKILLGEDGTGCLFSAVNQQACREEHGGSADLVTGDGGFDFSLDFNQQEGASMRLLLAQVLFCVAVQKTGGRFILKVFDTFTQASIDVLYLLSSLYESVTVVKPSTSRQANSEKYLVCRGYRGLDTKSVSECLSACVSEMGEGKHMVRLYNYPLPHYYTMKIEEMNAVLGQQQLESIASTLGLMDSTKPDRLESLRKINIQKCIAWCQRHRLPYNRSVCATNIFLAARGSPRRAGGHPAASISETT